MSVEELVSSLVKFLNEYRPEIPKMYNLTEEKIVSLCRYLDPQNKGSISYSQFLRRLTPISGGSSVNFEHNQDLLESVVGQALQYVDDVADESFVVDGDRAREIHNVGGVAVRNGREHGQSVRSALGCLVADGG